MRILIVHNRYQQEGGEDSVLSAEMRLLEDKGHSVELFEVNNLSIQKWYDKVRIALNLTYSRHFRDKLFVKLTEFKPEIVHIHNFFPLLTPSVYDACRNAAIPVVQTLHNYRTICAGALLMRGGGTCELCISNSPYIAVVHGCYRNSRVGTFAVAAMIKSHRDKRTWKQKVDGFIALTEFAKSKFVAAGFPDHKIYVKPNFTIAPRCADGLRPRNGALFVGRLSKEKGVHTLLKAWENLDFALEIVGDGPLARFIPKAGTGRVKWSGHKNREEVSIAMRKAEFLIMPSESFETFGMVLIEAFSHGLPVIASRLGSMAEIVDDGVTGLLFEAGNVNDLAAKINWAIQHPKEMRLMAEAAREVYENLYTSDVNYGKLLEIYSEAILNYDVRYGHRPSTIRE